MSLLDSTRELVGRLIHLVYNKRIRPQLPRVTAEYNGISVKRAYLFDNYLPWLPYHKPQYEQGLLDGIVTYVDSGDSVIVIGGGSGVSSIYAARETGESGVVHTYEASTEMMAKIRDTFSRNDFPSVVTLHHGVVGEAIHVWGDSQSTSQIPVSNLPNSDVLVIDAEGAEVGILNDLDQRPESIIVETHGVYGSSSADVSEALHALGYTVVEKMIAEPRKPEMCREDDVYVLYAELDP